MKNKEKNFISIVAYSHNSEEYICDFIKKINEFFNKNFEHYEIIIVDDKSSDLSIKKLKESSYEIQDTVLSIINMSYYQGIEASMNAGVDLAIGDFVFEFDTMIIDYDINVIMDVYKKCLEGNDIVCAASDKKTRLSSKLFYHYYNKSNINKLSTETFGIISRRAINRVKEVNKTIPYRKAVYANCGLKKGIIKYNSALEKINYISKETNNYRKDLAIDSIVLFTNMAYKFAVTMSIIMMLALFITAIYTIIIFISKNPIAGWTTIMLLISFAFFGLFSILTIILKYLSILIKLIFKKQDYLIESIEKVTK